MILGAPVAGMELCFSVRMKIMCHENGGGIWKELLTREPVFYRLKGESNSIVGAGSHDVFVLKIFIPLKITHYLASVILIY